VKAKKGIGFILGLVLILSGCGPRYFQGLILPDIAKYPLKRIAIIPFASAPGKIPSTAPEGGEQGEELTAFEGVKVEPEAQKEITKIFTEKLEKAGKFSLIPQEEVATVMDRMGLKMHEIPPGEAVLKLGQSLRADAVLVGSVSAYAERRGGPLAVDRPATVGFTASLISIPDGETLWTGNYFERQQSLTENIALFPLFWKRHGRWVTARDLAEYGVEQALKTWPSPQEDAVLEGKTPS
jgi:hypothetical protein